MDYKKVVCGGTFDHLHEGHKDFLRFIFSVGEQAIIGLTSDTFIQTYKEHPALQTYGEREKALRHFLETENLSTRAHIVKIDDIYGPSINPSIALDAVIVTDETQKGGALINEKRRSLGLSSLPLVIMPRVTQISSSLIRDGKIDTSGSLFIEEKWVTEKHTLPQDLRKALQEPFGELLTADSLPEVDDAYTITVGDATTVRFHNAGKKQKISVVDFIVERQPLYESFSQLGFDNGYETYEVVNPPATLTPLLWEVAYQAFMTITRKEIVIRVKGEEDLAVIPLILVSPLGYDLFYGQPHRGLVWVKITLEAKQKAYQLLKRFL